MKVNITCIIVLFFMSFTHGQTTYVVNTVDDTEDANLNDTICADTNGNCSLRAAIQNANKTSNKDTIAFDLNGTSPFVLSISLDVLPSIQRPVILDGRTQEGYSNAPLIEVDGSLLGPGYPGIQIIGSSAAGSEMYGLSVGGFQSIEGNPFNNFGIGIWIQSVNDITLQGNYVGLRSDGSTLFTNTAGGVFFFNSSNNLVGGTNSGEGNVISGNFSGGLTFQGGGNNLVQGNLLGTDITGTLNRGNRFNMQLIDSSNNIVGGSVPEARNIVSGGKNDENDTFDGTGFSIAGALATGNKILGNYIGTDITGTVSIPNLRGGVLLLFGASNNEIGGINPGDGNLISGNGASGIYFQGSDDRPVSENLIQGNLIGTDITGNQILKNTRGLSLFFGVNINNVIGGTTPGARNIISGNDFGVDLISAENNSVVGNYIGTNISGNSSLPNSIGIRVGEGINLIGGTSAESRNIISGNNTGVSLESSKGTILEGNYIGTDVSGTAALPNQIGVRASGLLEGTIIQNNVISGNGLTAGVGRNLNLISATQLQVYSNIIGLQANGIDLPGGIGVIGVILQNSSNNIIGGATPDLGNVISGNGTGGITVIFNSSGNQILNNLIGVAVDGETVIGNGAGTSAGVVLTGTISSGLISKNILTGSGYGVFLDTGAGSATGVTISENSIYGNSLKGIRLAGANTNDPGDADAGPNNLQNYPEIISIDFSGGNQVEITYEVPSLPANSAYPLTVEFFGAESGQGKIYLGTDTYVTTGTKSFTANFPDGFNQNDFEFIVGTATDANGNTSEFGIEASLSSFDFQLADFSLYPNPASNWFKVNLNTNQNHSITLISITGQLIKEYKNVSGELTVSVEDLPQGIYLVQIQNETNNQSLQRKLIIN